MPLSPATPDARLRIALGASAELRLGAGLAALILALLIRLLGRTEASWDLSPQNDNENDIGSTPYALVMPAIGRAPHAACIEAGLVPDWILPGIRNRGMRPAARPARRRLRARAARAPPPPCFLPR